MNQRTFLKTALLSVSALALAAVAGFSIQESRADSGSLKIYKFEADWCGPCNVLMPILDKLAKAYAGEFLLAQVDADENMRIAGRYRVRGFPTVIALVNGQEVDRFHSAQREPFVEDFIEKHLF